MCKAINRYSSKYSIPTCDDRIVSDIVRPISVMLLLTCHSMLPDREEVYRGGVYKVIRANYHTQQSSPSRTGDILTQTITLKLTI